MPSSTRSILGPVVVTFALLSLIAPQSPLAAQQPGAPVGAYDASPYLGEIRNTVLYGDIWERPQLSARDRSLITVAVTQALYASQRPRRIRGGQTPSVHDRGRQPRYRGRLRERLTRGCVSKGPTGGGRNDPVGGPA